MNYHAQYRRENGGKLVLYRKCFGWLPKVCFTRYLPFDNKLKKVENEMDELTEKLFAKYAEHTKLRKEMEQIDKAIDAHHGDLEGIGPTVVMSLPLFPRKHTDMPKPKGIWHKFRSILKGGQATLAEMAGGVSGAHTTSVNGERVGKATPPQPNPEDVAGSTDHRVVPEKKQQGKQQQGKQQ